MWCIWWFKSLLFFQDEDDQQFLMDELGNIEASPRCALEDGGASYAQECWGDANDDASYLEALNEVEKTMEEKEEIPDELMIQALTECENTLVWGNDKMNKLYSIFNA